MITQIAVVVEPTHSNQPTQTGPKSNWLAIPGERDCVPEIRPYIFGNRSSGQ
jgi:hypothetical protein